MKKIINKIKFLSLVVLSGSLFSNVTFAQNADCSDSFAPAFICDRVASLTGSFSIGSAISLIISLAIFVLILFFIFSIVKAGISWINKSGDDKSRSAAIKAISNAVIAFVSVLVLLVVLFVATVFLGINGTPNILYACYSNTVFSPNAAAHVDPYTASLRSSSGIKEIPNVFVFEGIPSTQFNVTGTLVSAPSVVFDQATVDFMSKKLYCKDNKTGEEFNQGYVILKRIGVKKS